MQTNNKQKIKKLVQRGYNENNQTLRIGTGLLNKVIKINIGHRYF